MRRVFYERPFKFILIPFAAAAFLAVVSFVVMSLWNVLLPAILHVGVITFWQAMGIFILCKLLFGFGRGQRMGGRGGWGRNRMEERFRSMTPEDKEKFKEKIKDYQCNWGRHGRGRQPFEKWDDFTEKTEKAGE